jgi:2-polyprenyl-3-methyl-5-hydroxy-6-metoxy-1,4-benzoquinol methylase
MYHPTPASARERYDLHRNGPNDAAYRQFLNRLAEPLAARLTDGAEGLDFGSGPCPVLSLLLAERGFRMSQYDPLYAPERTPLSRQYDFVACSETVEHFTDPAHDFDVILGMVREGGWIGIMTCMVEPGTDFARWRYANDVTHVCFYARSTFEWWAARHSVTAEFPAQNVCLLRVLRAKP